MAAFAAIKRVAKLGTKSDLTGFGASKNFPFISGHKHFSSSGRRRESPRLRVAIRKEHEIASKRDQDRILEDIRKEHEIASKREFDEAIRKAHEIASRREQDRFLEAIEKETAKSKKIFCVCTTATAFLLVGDALKRKNEESK